VNVPVRLLLFAPALLLSGCYELVDGAYMREVTPESTGGGEAVVRAGVGDLREEGHAWGIESMIRLGFAPRLARFGFGSGVQFAPLTGWDHDWTPFWRLGAYLLQLEWVRGDAGAAISPFAEAGVLFLDGQETRDRTLWTVGARFDYTARRGDDAAFVSIFLGWGHSHSMGPLS